mgnify:CR=1 FL=1
MILYEDKNILVCRKAAGIAVQSARLGEKDLVSILNNHLAEQAEAYKKSGSSAVFEPVRVIHRLDQPVEGVLVFAKTKKAAAGLSKQIADGTMKKTYQAVCCVTEKGRKWPETKTEEKEEWHALTDYLVKDVRTNTSVVTEKGQKNAKEARLLFQIAAQQGELVLVNIRLNTGRHHQIRVQMAHAGLPLYGDVKYHSDWQRYVPDSAAGRTGRGEPALCASRLEFIHPITGKKMEFEAEPRREIFGLFQQQGSK